MKNIQLNKHYLLPVIFLFFTAVSFAQKDTLTIEKCIDLALKNNPQIKIAESNYDLSSSNLKSARSVLLPQVYFNSGWNRNGGYFFTGPSAREATFGNYSYGFQLQQQVFDFGKSISRVSGTSDLESASKEDLASAKQNLILNAYIAYFSYLQAIRIKNVSTESLQQAQEHLRQAKSFYDVGKSPEFDVLKAKTDEANAQVNLLNSENNILVSRLQLENIMNTKIDNEVPFKDNLEITKDTVEIQNALKSAWENRPEFIGAKLRVDANKSFVTSAWTANLPSINLTGGYNWKTFSLQQNFLDSWNLGVTLSLPIFQGFALDAGIDQSRANLKNAEATFDFIKQNINLDVQQQYTNVKLAVAKIDATKSFLTQAEETLKIADGRYKQGVGSPIEITDARVTLLNAQILNIQALYDYQVSYVRLQKAIGILQ
ncbi:MAG: TolC family protein [Ignavibacteriaceae bacterium]|jgi:TolC family type I secretion outer membrane protein